MAKIKNKNQIIRKDGKDCFVESLKNSFAIEKVMFKFATYDLSKPQGQKFTNEIDIYIDFKDFFRISNELFNTGIMMNKLYEFANTAAQTNKFPESIMLSQGGSSKKSLELAGKQREDGHALARILKLTKGTKLFLLRAECGPGTSDKNGLIVKDYGNNPEQFVVVGLTYENLEELFLSTAEEIKAYLSAASTVNQLVPDLKYIEETVFNLTNNQNIQSEKLDYLIYSIEQIKQVLGIYNQPQQHQNNQSNQSY